MKFPDSVTETVPSADEKVSPEPEETDQNMEVATMEIKNGETKDHPVNNSVKENTTESGSNKGIDKQDVNEELVTQEHNLELKDVTSKPLENETNYITDSNDKPNLQTDLPAVPVNDDEISAKNQIHLANSKDMNDKTSFSDVGEDKSSLPEVDIHIKELNTTKPNDSSDDVDSSIKNKPNDVELNDITMKSEAYDNQGFVPDEVSGKPSEVITNLDVVPLQSLSPESNVGLGKLPRRVSFSDMPSKAVYDNLGFVSDGKSGTPQDSTQGEEIDFLEKYGPGEKWRILRNVVLISAAFMVLFTSFFGAANLQSSVNAKAGLGTVSLSTLYGALIVSNIFLPVMVIRWLRCKWTVALGALGFAPYAIAQFHAEFYTLIPTAFLAGLGAAPMWCAKCTYLNVAADAFAKVTGSSPEVVMVRFFGIFYVLFPLGHVWGNLISSEVLSKGTEEDKNVTIDVAALCGANYCPGLGEVDNPNLQRPPDYQINTIAAIFVACSLLSVLLVALGVDNLSRYNEGGRKDSGTGLSGLQLLIASAKLLCNRNQLVLIPITAFIGISQAFLGADFTEGYISCAWGIPHIGYVLIGYGLASSLASVFVSWVVKTAGRLVVISSSITLFLILVTVLKFWEPSASQGAIYFILAALWGLADSTAMVINAMYGLLFRGNEAAAYSNFSLWGSAGFIVTYSYSPHLCMNTKLAILAVVLILALAGFVTAEMALRRIIREQEEEDNKKTTVTGKPQVL